MRCGMEGCRLNTKRLRHTAALDDFGLEPVVALLEGADDKALEQQKASEIDR